MLEDMMEKQIANLLATGNAATEIFVYGGKQCSQMIAG